MTRVIYAPIWVTDRFLSQVPQSQSDWSPMALSTLKSRYYCAHGQHVTEPIVSPTEIGGSSHHDRFLYSAATRLRLFYRIAGTIIRRRNPFPMFASWWCQHCQSVDQTAGRPPLQWPRVFKGGFVHGPEEIRRCSTPTMATPVSKLLPGQQHHPEAGLIAEHPPVSVSRLLQRNCFYHRANVFQRAERQRVFVVDRRAGQRAFN